MDQIQDDKSLSNSRLHQQLSKANYSFNTNDQILMSESQSPTKFHQKRINFLESNSKQNFMENGIEQASSEKLQKAYKVHFIYEKLQDRLKLRKRDGDLNFRKMMHEFRQLDTFVDTRQEIQSMNLAFQKGFKSSLEVLKIRDKIQQLNKELKDTSSKYQMQFGEYEVIDEQAEQNNLGGVKGAKQAKELLRRSKKYLQTKSKNMKIYDSTQAITESLKDYIQKHTQTVNQIELKDDTNEFYSNLESVFEHQKRLISLKEQHAELERKKQEEKEKQLRELIKLSKYDINGGNEKAVPNQGYFDEYHKNTQKTINKALKESQRIYRQKLGLISQKDKLFLDIQENIIDKNQEKQQPEQNDLTSPVQNKNNFFSQTISATKVQNIQNQQQKEQKLPIFQSRSSTNTPLKTNFITQQPDITQSSFNKLNQRRYNQNAMTSYNSMTRLNQSSINKTYIPSGEIQEEKVDYDDQQEEQEKAQKLINNLAISPSIQNSYKNISTLSTARETEKITIPLLQINNNQQNLNHAKGQRQAQTQENFKEKVARDKLSEFSRSSLVNTSQNALRHSRIDSFFDKNPFNQVKQKLNSRMNKNSIDKITLQQKNQRYSSQTEQTPNAFTSDSDQTPLKGRKKSLGGLTDEVSNLVKIMAERSPKQSEIKRLSSLYTPKSTRFTIEKKNIFLSNIESQQETIKQFISTMKEAEVTYKEEKQKLMQQLLEAKQQYKSTQERYEDPKITSIREVEQNVEHKFKNFLRRNYKPKTLQIANY
ncbi:hypothetical protein TTHERM_00334330 (macronuclear) [Tetrahymena thermophila SB210]|uniref:Uncharacterized protein n=1 Tax=Tetrahymena thermophila (strain SB210) TaxID=312017 RepID=I7M865_TETTS|nr:hypothetical protein TTHERM_00334330 [Tetrahymena thermophila SB210]EAR97256.1 hypothetical protein TTHERM_00334330 [Tetrahymena thermophila SB210]|eukprot:XP_001017501.1 hypothetical protein TTHERM_00334330 [Tetrahymena thermophila SB210]